MLVPTPRLLVLTLAGVLPMVLAGTHDRALAVACVWLAGIFLIALVDAWFVFPGSTVHWSRDHDSKLSLGQWNSVTLTARHSFNSQVVLEARDATPALFLVEGNHGRGTCPGLGAWTLRYRVFPIHRGDYSLGPIAFRLRGPLGFAWVQYSRNLDDRVQVYPDLLAIRSYEGLVQRGQLQEIGLRNSRLWGSGTEFERLRDYTPDDEFRRINWKATARRHRPVAVDYQEERSQNIMIVLDAGRLMATRLPLPDALTPTDRDAVRSADGAQENRNELAHPVALTRLDYAVNTSVLLAYVSQRFGDRVGLLSFSDRVLRYVPGASGRGQLIRLIQALHDLEPEATESDYDSGLSYLAVRNRRRSLLVLFTDLTEQDAAERLIANLGQLVHRHLPLVVTLRDPAVEKIATLPPTTVERVYERAVARSLLDSREATLRHLRLSGALTLDVPANLLSASVINRYLEIKARTAL